MWKRTVLTHGISSTVDLYAVEADGSVELAIAGVDKKGRPQWFEHDRLKGTLADFHLDQRGAPIPWEETAPPLIESAISDMFQARQRSGHQDGVEFLHVELANAIGASRVDPAFARRAKKLIVGTWKSSDTSITFSADGTYSTERIDPVLILAMASRVGRWSLASNMLLLMGDDKRGARSQLVDINESIMVLPGFGRALRYVLDRVANA